MEIELRKAYQIREDGSEKRIAFKDIKKGMKISLDEPTGGRVHYKGNHIFEAATDAYLNKDIIWTFDTD